MNRHLGRRDTRARERRFGPWSMTFLLLSIVAHVAALALLPPVLSLMPAPEVPPKRERLTLVVREAPKEPVVEPPEPEPPKFEGQIVEISPPKVEEKPLESDYLSEYDAKVEKETRTEQFEINPEVLAREYSKEQKAEQADVEDLNVDEPSTGATVGNNRFDPDRDGTLAALPSPWKQTNKQGPDAPIPSSQRDAMLSGAPQNDLLREDIGKVLDLNSTRYPYASYMDRVRRQVNYWWQQNLSNLPSSVRLSKSKYRTNVAVVLDADGALEHIEIQLESGSDEVDDCLVRAFRVAAPFENPPAGLIQKDGRVYLPDFEFELGIQAAQVQYQGIDPRAGVQFPGILKSPR